MTASPKALFQTLTVVNHIILGASVMHENQVFIKAEKTLRRGGCDLWEIKAERGDKSKRGTGRRTSRRRVSGETQVKVKMAERMLNV